MGKCQHTAVRLLFSVDMTGNGFSRDGFPQDGYVSIFEEVDDALINQHSASTDYIN